MDKKGLSSKAVNFINMIPEDQTLGHRADNPVADTSGVAAGTVLIGDTYLGTPTAALSSSSPSANAPDGGILVRTLWEFTPASDGQCVNFDIAATGPGGTPGSKTVVVDPATGGTVQHLLPESNLGDFVVGSDGPAAGAPSCVAATPTPTPTGGATPTSGPGTATPTSTPKGSSFNPADTLHLSDTTPGAHPDISSTLNLKAPDPNFSAVVAFSPPEMGVPKDADIPDGAIVGTLTSTATLGFLSNACATSILVNFTFEDATTDTTNTIDPLPPGTPDPLAPLAGDTSFPHDGIPDIKPPPGVTKYPSYLNTLFPGIKPRARYAAATWISAASTWVILQFVVFEPGTQLPGLPAFDPALGYPSVTVLQDPTAPASPSSITDFCTPLLTSTTLYGMTRDNPDTPANEAGIVFRTNPATAGAYNFVTYSASQRDADGDGTENSLDPCPFNKDTVWDPRAPQPQGDAGGIPDTCDAQTTIPSGGQLTDQDGDGFLNRGDNCPQVYNPDQLDTDKDGIGDACDTPGLDAGTDCLNVGCVPGAGNPLPPRDVAGNGPTVPDGAFFTCWKTATLQIGGSPDGVVSDCSETGPTPPPNDDFGNAVPIGSLPFADSLNTGGATTEPGEPTSVCAPTGATVWYVFTPAQNITVEADTFGSGFGTVLAAFTGSNVAGLQPVGCQSKGGRLILDLAAGTSYYFQIGGFAGQTGNLVFNLATFVRLNIGLSIDQVGSVVPSTGIAAVSGSVTCTKPAFVNLQGSLRQQAGRTFIKGFFSMSLQCDGSSPWHATVTSDNGRFAAGRADVSLSAIAFSGDEVASAQASATVRLQGTRSISGPCPRTGNDGFEAGAVDTNVIPCWTVVDQTGSFGSWCNQRGTVPPQGPCSGSLTTVAAPPEGLQAAMTNQSFVGSHVLYRCGRLSSGNISFKLYLNNEAGEFSSPATLDFNAGPNQQFRADLVSAAAMAANPFTVAPADVLLNLYQTKPGDPRVSGYDPIAGDASAFVRKDVCLRFAMVDNLFFFHAGVDAVSISLR